MSLVGLGCRTPVRIPQTREVTLESEAGSGLVDISGQVASLIAGR